MCAVGSGCPRPLNHAPGKYTAPRVADRGRYIGTYCAPPRYLPKSIFAGSHGQLVGWWLVVSRCTEGIRPDKLLLLVGRCRLSTQRSLCRGYSCSILVQIVDSTIFAVVFLLPNLQTLVWPQNSRGTSTRLACPDAHPFLPPPG